MGQQADSRNSDSPEYYDAIGCLILAVLLAAVLGLWILYTNIAERFFCVEMPNGLLIGRATVFSKMHAGGGSDADIAIKYPDGRILRRGDGTISFYDFESMAGSYPSDDESKFNRFIYIKDVGLFIESEQPDQFRHYWETKKKEIFSEPSSNLPDSFGGNLHYTYLMLDKNREYQRARCPTAWFLPEK
ncbi:hypothetical protein [Maritalea myrionectae]|uniref:hypothetical protein n=1 Tax=Maritalea myrionectae TaxID=454601 RepID=UPI00041231B4|nr:hypothetical protein [Maritalea myrionectae]